MRNVLSKKLMGGLASLLLVCGSIGSAEAGSGADARLKIFSPSPPSVMLHQLNLTLGQKLNDCGIQNTVIPLALPDSINQFSSGDSEKKKTELPIVTTIDFFPAVHRKGPSWHSYAKPNTDLKFVASLYDVAFGVLAFDKSIKNPEDLKGKRIGAPPRPSAVRVFTEALLRDGWGILDDVEIVDIYPPALIGAVTRGEIQATTWNLVTQSANGVSAVVPDLLELENGAWLEADEEAVRAMNEASAFEVDITYLQSDAEAQTALFSFRQALAAWEATPDETITNILSCMTDGNPISGDLYSDIDELAKWPGLDAMQVHRAALAFYRKRGSVIFENNQ